MVLGSLVMSDSALSIDPFGVNELAQANAFVSVDEQAATSCQSLGELRGVLTMQQAVTRALCNSPKLAQSVAESQAAAAGVGASLANYMPRVAFNIDYNWSEQRFDSSNSTSKLDRRGDTLRLNWQLFDFGRTQAKVEQSKSLVEVANATQDVVMQQVFIDGLTAYFEAIVAQSQWQARRKARDVAKQSVDVVQGRYTGGVGTQDELLQAKSRLAQSELAQQKAEDLWVTKRGLLANRLGLPMLSALQLPEPEQLSIANRSFLLLGLEQQLEYAAEQHPRISVAKAQQQASYAKVALAQAEHLPSLALNGQYVNSPPPSGSIFVPDYYSNIGLQLSVPLSQGFETTYRVKEAQAEATAKRFAIEQEVLQVKTDVWQAFQEWKSSERQRRELVGLFDLAKQLEKVTQARYRSGVGNVFDWLEAQKLLAEVESDYLQKTSEEVSAQLRLAGTTGRVQLSLLP